MFKFQIVNIAPLLKVPQVISKKQYLRLVILPVFSTFFFLEHAGELRIIVLIEEESHT